MNYIIQLDLPFYTILSLVFLFYFYYTQYKFDDLSNKIYLTVVISTLVLLSIDTLTWIAYSLSHPYSYVLNYILTFLLYSLYIIPLIAWLAYFDYKIFEDIEAVILYLKHYSIGFLIIFIAQLVNILTPILFFIDTNNQYQRGPFYLLVPIVIYSTYIYFLTHLWFNRKRIRMNILKAILCFFTLPLIASILQIVFYGIQIIWPSLALVTIISYMLLERDDMMKDPLTGLYSRRYIEQKINRNIIEGTSFSLIMIDMDHFKDINDTYGHDAGDQALIIVSSIITSHIKRRDIACRYGGDEFMILLNSSNPFGGEIVSTRLSQELFNYNQKKLVPYILEMSAGIIYVDAPTDYSPHQLFQLVDKEMYCVKKMKRQ